MFKRCSEIENRFPGESSTWVLFKTWFWNSSNHSGLNHFFLPASFENVLIFLIPIAGRSVPCTQDRACWVSRAIISPPDYSLPNAASLTCVLLQEHLRMKERHSFVRLSMLTFQHHLEHLVISALTSNLLFCPAVLTAFFHVHRKINSCHAPHWADELPARGGQVFFF